METAIEFTYLCDEVSGAGGCEAVVTARIRCGWGMFRECDRLLLVRGV